MMREAFKDAFNVALWRVSKFFVDRRSESLAGLLSEEVGIYSGAYAATAASAIYKVIRPCLLLCGDIHLEMAKAAVAASGRGPFTSISLSPSPFFLAFPRSDSSSFTFFPSDS